MTADLSVESASLSEDNRDQMFPSNGNEAANIRPVDAILGNLVPAKSKLSYDKAWTLFKEHCQLQPGELPKEEHVMGYFDFLHREKKYKSSTLWSTFSMLNHCHQLEFGGLKLQDKFPRVKIQLKCYNAGYERKVAKVFEKSQIDTFLAMDHDGPVGFWLLRKAVAAIAFVGGLRIHELKNLKMEDVTEAADGIWINYTPAKQRGEVKRSRFLVPLNPHKPS